MSLWNKYDLVALMTLSVTRNERTFQFWTKPTVTLQFCEKMRCSMNWISRAIFHFDNELIFAHHKIKLFLNLFLPGIKIIEKSDSKKAKNWTMEQELMKYFRAHFDFINRNIMAFHKMRHLNCLNSNHFFFITLFYGLKCHNLWQKTLFVGIKQRIQIKNRLLANKKKNTLK